MKIMKIFLVFTLFLIAGNNLTWGDTSKTTIIVGNKEYLKSQIIWDFTNIAFSSHLWLDNISKPWISVVDISESTAAGKQMPRHSAINKWNIPIDIGVYGASNDFTEKDQARLKKFSDLVFQQAEELKVEISYLTGLPVQVSLIEKMSTEFTKIRIFPMSDDEVKNKFKVIWRDPLALSGQASYLSNYPEGVPFTSLSESQVDGVLIPDDLNNMSYSICKISPDLNVNLTKSLVSECLLRSLGLPEISKISDVVLPCSGDIQVSQLRRRVSGCAHKVPFLSGGTLSLLEAWGEKNSSENERVASLKMSAYDKLMISLLYCPAIKAGMDKYQVIQALSKNEKCFITK